MRTVGAALGITALIAMRQVSAQALETDSGHVIANAVAHLAKTGQEVNFREVARALKLPDLEQKIRWNGPPDSYTSQRFNAYYFPSTSELGITGVLISWSPTRSLSSQKKFLTTLELEISSSSCPTYAALEESIGGKPLQYTSPGFDGGPSYDTTSFPVPQSNGEPGFVSFLGTNTCRITVANTRDIVG